MQSQHCEMGMVGLGVMGRNLLLNMADKGFSVAGYDRDKSKVDVLRHESKGRPIHAAATRRSMSSLPFCHTLSP